MHESIKERKPDGTVVIHAATKRPGFTDCGVLVPDQSDDWVASRGEVTCELCSNKRGG